MAQASRWTQREFDVLLDNNNLSHHKLAKLLPNRTPGAIEVVREGIHAFHSGTNISMLSQMMRETLSQSRDNVVCPKCGSRL